MSHRRRVDNRCIVCGAADQTCTVPHSTVISDSGPAAVEPGGPLVIFQVGNTRLRLNKSDAERMGLVWPT